VPPTKLTMGKAFDGTVVSVPFTKTHPLELLNQYAAFVSMSALTKVALQV